MKMVPRGRRPDWAQGFRDPDAHLGNLSTASPTLTRLSRNFIMSVATMMGMTLFTSDISRAFCKDATSTPTPTARQRSTRTSPSSTSRASSTSGNGDGQGQGRDGVLWCSDHEGRGQPLEDPPWKISGQTKANHLPEGETRVQQ